MKQTHKTVTVQGLLVSVPIGLSREDEEAFIANVEHEIANSPKIQDYIARRPEREQAAKRRIAMREAMTQAAQAARAKFIADEREQSAIDGKA